MSLNCNFSILLSFLSVIIKLKSLNFNRKSLEEHKKTVEDMNKEKRELEEAMAKSLHDQQRLEKQMIDQRSRLEDHLKATGVEPNEGN